MRDSGLFDVQVAPQDEVWSPPESVEDLVLLLDPSVSDHPIIDFVTFTGDLDAALEVDKRDTFGRIAGKFWEYATVLYDYGALRASGYAGSLHMYLGDETAAGRKCPTHRHAAVESESVLSNTAMRNERHFGVPREVDPTGKALMAAHFKPPHSDTFAPRMHYLDDTASTGKIYVGYIGRHLSNTRTN